jgi:hypothetical protein
VDLYSDDMTEEKYNEIADAIEALSLSDAQIAALAHHGLATGESPELLYVLADQAGLNNSRGEHYSPVAMARIERALRVLEGGAIPIGPGQSIQSVLAVLAR